MNLAQAKTLKTGDRVRYTCEGPDFGDEGTVTSLTSRQLVIEWDDGALLDYRLDRNGDYHARNLELVK